MAGSRASRELEKAKWLIPIEDHRQLDLQREGMLAGYTLTNYLLLVEHVGQVFPSQSLAAQSG